MSKSRWIFVAVAAVAALAVGLGGAALAQGPEPAGEGEMCAGIQGIPCADKLWCDLRPGVCAGSDVDGVCVKVPEICSRVYEPVCGCDGKTHPNDCERRRARVQKRHDGRCDVPEVCTLAPETGPCRARFERFFFDAAKQTCATFIYGGCLGNANNFETLAECSQACGVCGLPKEPGPCKAIFWRFWFNAETGKCEKFQYGGCGGNANNFETEAACEEACGSADRY